MNNDFYVEPQDKPARDNFCKKTWILLFIIWVLCLIPIPFSGTIAMVMNFAAFVMAIVVLAKGHVRYGVLQLLSVFILTPVFYFIGVLISAALISHTLDTGNLSKQTLQEAFFNGLNDEVADIYKISGKDKKPKSTVQAPLQKNKQDISLSKPKQQSQEKEKVITWYVAYTKEGAEIRCSDIVKKNDLLMLKTKSGMEIDVHTANILKVVRYRTVGNKTKKSVWNPAKG